MDKKDKRAGGVRPGAGRKQTEDKIVPVYIGLRQSVIQERGGKEVVKIYSEFYINNIDEFKYKGDES